MASRLRTLRRSSIIRSLLPAGTTSKAANNNRWQIIGMIERVIVVLVASTIEEVGQDEVIRLI